MSDAEKLRLLADWFDTQYPNDETPEVQADLRRIAAHLATVTAERDALKVQVEEGFSLAGLLLPLAKGYAQEHRVGNNEQFVTYAEKVLADRRANVVWRRRERGDERPYDRPAATTAMPDL